MSTSVPSAWPWPAPIDDGGARHLVPGMSLPDIPLPATYAGGTVSLPRCGEESGVGAPNEMACPRSIVLAALPGKSVVFIYPWTGRAGLPNPPDWDHIPGAHGSTPQAEGFRDLHADFTALGAAVFGLSTQAPAHYAELAARLALPYPLLSDAGFAFARALRLPTFETGGVTYLRRLTLIVRDGRLVRAFYPVHPPDTHATEVRAWLAGGSTSAGKA